MIIKKPCLTCHKPSDTVSEMKMPTFILYQLKCGHSLIEKVLPQVSLGDIQSFKSIDNKSPFHYQSLGIDFLFKSNGRCLIADEMGLGKTMQSAVPIALRKLEFTPCVIVCKSVATGNWFKEIVRFGKCLAQHITTTADTWHTVFPIYIISYDLLTRISKEISKDPTSHLDYQDIIKTLRYVIIDETHLIKNPSTQRATAVKRLTENVPHVVGLSGTPIKNNACELFTILNILYPQKYFRYETFCHNNVKQIITDKGGFKYGGLKYPDRFKLETESFIIRRTMDEVFPDLPKLMRNPKFVDLAGEVSDIYNKEQEAFAEYFDENQGDVDFMTNILAMMAKLRHLTSLAKIPLCIDTVMEFLYSTDRKLAIFTHHLDTRDILAERLNEQFDILNKEVGETLYEPVMVLAGEKDTVEASIAKFKDSKQRVLILSTQSHGESLNLQFISDSILHERQWNPANEDQAISGRFRRIGQEAKTLICNILIAIGTIDEMLSEIVERKREYFESTMQGKELDQSWDESSIIMDLARTLAEKGRRKWKLT